MFLLIPELAVTVRGPVIMCTGKLKGTMRIKEGRKSEQIIMATTDFYEAFLSLIFPLRAVISILTVLAIIKTAHIQ